MAVASIDTKLRQMIVAAALGEVPAANGCHDELPVDVCGSGATGRAGGPSSCLWMCAVVAPQAEPAVSACHSELLTDASGSSAIHGASGHSGGGPNYERDAWVHWILGYPILSSEGCLISLDLMSY